LSRAMATSVNLLLLRRQACTEILLAAKKNKGVKWEEIGTAIGRSPVWVASCVFGENSMDEESAKKLVECLGINDSTTAAILMEPPLKGQIPQDLLRQDPTIYRFHEINIVYGLALKEVIQEKFGDGIMSAVDFKCDVEEERETPDGPPRVKIVMSGKFLPYKRW